MSGSELNNVLILGSGKIGRMIAKFLVDSGDYSVRIADADPASLKRLRSMTRPEDPIEVLQIDASSEPELQKAMQGMDGVVSALSYHFNPRVAEVAAQHGLHYFDLTEDVETTRAVRESAKGAKHGQLFIPQCGLAPGFISIAANHVAKSMDELDKVFMRVGALPQFPSNALKYNLTWSTDGLINEYCNPCEAIHNGELRTVLPLEGLEHFSLDGVRYEAFNTSGGLGSLCETLAGKVNELNYKTIRYQGHRDLAAFLVNELQLSQHRDELKQILERSVPVTFQDVVVIFCTVSGFKNGQYLQLTDARKIYHQKINGVHWSAIQITTAAGVCAIIDLVRDTKLTGTGFLAQETVDLEVFLNNRFGQYYRSQISSRYSISEEELRQRMSRDSQVGE